MGCRILQSWADEDIWVVPMKLSSWLKSLATPPKVWWWEARTTTDVTGCLRISSHSFIYLRIFKLEPSYIWSSSLAFTEAPVDTVMAQTGQSLWCHPLKTQAGHPQITGNHLSGIACLNFLLVLLFVIWAVIASWHNWFSKLLTLCTSFFPRPVFTSHTFQG